MLTLKTIRRSLFVGLQVSGRTALYIPIGAELGDQVQFRPGHLNQGAYNPHNDSSVDHAEIKGSLFVLPGLEDRPSEGTYPLFYRTQNSSKNFETSVPHPYTRIISWDMDSETSSIPATIGGTYVSYIKTYDVTEEIRAIDCTYTWVHDNTVTYTSNFCLIRIGTISPVYRSSSRPNLGKDDPYWSSGIGSYSKYTIWLTTSPFSGTVISTSNVLDEVQSLFHQHPPLYKEIDEDEIATWSDLACDASDSISSSDLNSLETIGDLLELSKSLPPLLPELTLFFTNRKKFLKWASTLTSPAVLARYASELHIWWRYVFKTTLMDAKAWKETIDDFKSKVKDRSFVSGHSRDSNSIYTSWGDITQHRVYELTIRKSSSFFQDVYSGLESIGLLPKLTRLWDIIPLSFIIDWVVNVQDMLNTIDQNAFLDTFPVYSVCYSDKYVARIDASRDPFFIPYRKKFTLSGKFTQVKYDRFAGTKVHRPSPSFHFKNPTKQWLTATALTVCFKVK